MKKTHFNNYYDFNKYKIMQILEINGLKYSQEQFEGYKFRGIFKFNLGYNKFRSIDIYTTVTICTT